MQSYLIESALLTHGLKSISNQELLNRWPKDQNGIVWLEDGEIVVGDIEKFCRFRTQAGTYKRVGYRELLKAAEEGASAALTASGTMKVCEEMGAALAVTCGMGGLFTGQPYQQCNDLDALAQSEVSLVATAPKDMFDLRQTTEALDFIPIHTLGYEQDFCDGYLFVKEKVLLRGKWTGQKLAKKTLYLKGMDTEERLKDAGILETALSYGRKEEEKGRKFHPAVNGRLDDLSGGKSSRIQLDSLLSNIRWAEQLTDI